MIVAVCIDERNGMFFNKRRLSRDRAQQEDLLAFCAEKVLWISPYSVPLFDWAAERVSADERFLQKAGSGDVCFVEDNALSSVAGRMEKLVLYRWNRSYPADTYFDLELSDFQLVEQKEFPGVSHDLITREIYEKKA